MFVVIRRKDLVVLFHLRYLSHPINIMIVFQENKDLFFLRSSLQMSMKATHTDKHSGKKKKKKI